MHNSEINKKNINLPIISLEQQKVINLLEKENNVIVESVAGSGKTTTNLYIAKSFPTLKILLLTYNAKLKLETRERIKTHNITNLETHSYHSFCVKYYNNKAFTDTEINNIITLQTNILMLINYDIIILDELQDISPLYYNLICKIVKDNNVIAKICILGDRYQTIYNFKGADSRYIIHADKLFNFNSYNWNKCILSQSYRITHEMSEFINNCLLKESRIKSNKISHIKPRYIICNTFDESIRNIPFNQVKKFLSMGYKPTDIFILAPSIKSENNPVRKLENLIKLNIQDVPIYVPLSDDEVIDSDILKNKLVFSTFHQAKGLERKIVLVYNFDDSYFKFFNKDKDPLVCPNEYYVATTRASEQLILLHHYKNNYFEFLNIPNLEKYCNYIVNCNLKLENLKNKDSYDTSVSQLLKHLPDNVLDQCKSYLQIIKINPKDIKINIPNKIEEKHGFENVSEISGTMIPAYFEYKSTGKMTIFNELKNNFYKISKSINNDVDFIDDDDNDPNIKNYDINTININKENIDELLYIANCYCSWISGFKFKLFQISNYNWVTKEHLDRAYHRLNNFISINAKYETYVECSNNNNSRPELLNRRLHGAIDCIDSDNKIYEFKCVSKLETEHYLQLAIYMYLYENNNIITNKYYLYNILTNEMRQVICNYKELVNMVEYLIFYKYRNTKEDIDNIFLSKNKEIYNKYFT